MLQNAYFLAKIGADTAENEQHFAEILPIGRRVAADTTKQARARGGGGPRGPGQLRRRPAGGRPRRRGAGLGVAKLAKFQCIC